MHIRLKITLIFILLILVFLLGSVLNNKIINENSNAITLDDKIAQMLVIGYNNDKENTNRINSYVNNSQISGLIFYKRHINSPNNIKNIIDNLNKISKTKLFIMIDQEGGLVSRIATDNYFRTYPPAEYVALKYNEKEAYTVYYKMASDLKNVGFNFNVAPCVDIKTNKESSVGKSLRTYGNNPDIVTKYALAFIKAHNDIGVITALKHFPGLGNAKTDTHEGLPDITNTWNEKEMIPFKKIIKIYPYQPVMVGHVLNKKIDDKNISSLSANTIHLLTKDKNYNGIIIMDAVDMSAIQDLKTEDIIIKAINSGVNLFIFPNNVIDKNNNKLYMTPEEFINIVNKAVDSGAIKRSKIDDSYKKIIALKERI